MTRMQRLIVLAALAATLLVAAPAVEAATPHAPKGFYGVMWDRAAMDGGSVDEDAQWALMRRSGVESVRLVFSWARAQPEAGMQPDFSDTDAKVELAARNGIRLLPVVLNTPSWAEKYPGRHGSPPEFASDYAAFMSRLVERYGPAGSFWAERPDLPRRPLREWQIWNEPHFDFYWYTPGDDGAWAAEYVELLRAAHGAIKTADPGAQVVLAGFADASWKVLARAYEAGARGAFDVATINLFTGRPGFVMAAVRLTRRVLRRYHQARKPIWVTETTFPAAKGLVPPPAEDWKRRWYTTKSGMANRLTELYRLGAANARRLRLARIYWYTWASSYRGQDDLFDYSGLLSVGEDGASTAQPALRAFRRATRR
jgi:polysaccharide biosynthesis protein PslG